MQVARQSATAAGEAIFRVSLPHGSRRVIRWRDAPPSSEWSPVGGPYIASSGTAVVVTRTNACRYYLCLAARSSDRRLSAVTTVTSGLGAITTAAVRYGSPVRARGNRACASPMSTETRPSSACNHCRLFPLRLTFGTEQDRGRLVLNFAILPNLFLAKRGPKAAMYAPVGGPDFGQPAEQGAVLHPMKVRVTDHVD
jgi:hypothetical protein